VFFEFTWSRVLISPKSILLEAIGASAQGFAALHFGISPLYMLLMFAFVYCGISGFFSSDGRIAKMQTYKH
jgi:hypothetical protein